MSTIETPQLIALRDELNETTAHLHRLADPLDDTAWEVRAGDSRWSVAECVQHLNITSRVFVPKFHDAFQNARAKGLTGKPSYRLDLIGWFLLKGTEPPPRGRMKTPPDFVPASIEPKARVVREYEDLQRDLIALLAEAEGLALGRIKLRSPFNSKMKYNPYSAFRVIAAHQRRHLWQCERVLEHPAAQPR